MFFESGALKKSASGNARERARAVLVALKREGTCSLPFTMAKGRSNGRRLQKRRPPPISLHLLGVPKHFHGAEVAAHGARIFMLVGFAALVQIAGSRAASRMAAQSRALRAFHVGFAGERMRAAKATSPACAATREAMIPAARRPFGQGQMFGRRQIAQEVHARVRPGPRRWHRRYGHSPARCR